MATLKILWNTTSSAPGNFVLDGDPTTFNWGGTNAGLYASLLRTDNNTSWYKSGPLSTDWTQLTTDDLLGPPFVDQDIFLYVRPFGSDITGDGTLANPYRTVQFTIRVPPKDIPAGTTFRIENSGCGIEVLPDEYIFPEFTGADGVGAFDFTQPFFHYYNPVNIQADPQLATGVTGITTIPAAGPVPIVTTPKVSTGLKAIQSVGAGWTPGQLKGKLAIGAGLATNHSVIWDNTADTIFITRTGTPLFPLRIMEPSAGFIAGKNPSHLHLAAINILNSQMGLLGQKVSSNDSGAPGGFSQWGLQVGGTQPPTSFQLCHLPGAGFVQESWCRVRMCYCPDLLFAMAPILFIQTYVHRSMQQTTGIGVSGIGDALAFVAGIVTLTDAAAPFTVGMIGQPIKIIGATTPANNGTFTVATFINASNVTFANAGGVTEAFPGTWSINSTRVTVWGGRGPDNLFRQTVIEGTTPLHFRDLFDIFNSSTTNLLQLQNVQILNSIPEFPASVGGPGDEGGISDGIFWTGVRANLINVDISRTDGVIGSSPIVVKGNHSTMTLKGVTGTGYANTGCVVRDGGNVQQDDAGALAPTTIIGLNGFSFKSGATAPMAAWPAVLYPALGANFPDYITAAGIEPQGTRVWRKS